MRKNIDLRTSGCTVAFKISSKSPSLRMGGCLENLTLEFGLISKTDITSKDTLLLLKTATDTVYSINTPINNMITNTWNEYNNFESCILNNLKEKNYTYNSSVNAILKFAIKKNTKTIIKSTNQ